MKKLYTLILLLALNTGMLSAQAVNYTVNVTQIEWFEGGIGGDCQETGAEEYSALVWFDDDINGTDVGGNCFQCDNNGDCTINPAATLGTRNNTCAQTVNILFSAWEDDRGGRCTYDINGGTFVNDDDCGCGQTPVANINFRNNGPGCTTYGSFNCNASHTVQVEICWDYVTPPATNTDCSGAIAVGAGSTPFTLSEECSGPDITSCTFNDYNDIWYEYTVGTCHLEGVIFDTQGSGFDTALSIWDSCGGNEIACNDDSGGLQSSITIPGCIAPGTTYLIRVSGYNGADGTGTLNITETLDVTSPMFTLCPTQADISADVNCMAAIPNFTSTATATDNCDNTVTFTQTPTAGTMVGPGAQSVTVKATDDCTNSISTCVVNFNVIDNSGPDCIAQNVTANIDATGNASVTAAQIDNGSADNCAITSTTISAGQTAFTCADLGSAFTVTLQVMDAAGNSNTCDATVTVADPNSHCCDAPSAICQPFTAQLGVAGTITISATDVDGGSTAACGLQSLDLNNTAFTCANIGANTVTLTITDVNGDSDQCTSTVTLEDNVAPSFVESLPGDENLSCAEVIPAAATLTATDNCTNPQDVLFIENDDMGVCPTSRMIERTWTATDGNGNSVTHTQTITIAPDTENPSFIEALPLASINIECSDVIPLAATLTATDNCTDPITVVFEEVDDGALCPVSRIITRTWTATDDCGNEAIHTQTITIAPDTESPTISCPPNVSNLTSVTDLAPPDITTVTANDNCSATVTHIGDSPDPASFDFCLGNNTIIRTYQVDDGCNPAVSCEQRFSFDVLDCFEFTADDPCVCNNDQSANGAGDGTFNETVVVMGAPNVNLCVGPNSIGILDAATNVDISNTSASFIESPNPDGSATYTFIFNHLDAVGYTLELYDCDSGTSLVVDFNGNMTSTITNVCYYPVISFDMQDALCTNDGPVELIAAITNDMPDGMTSFNGTFSFTGSGVTGNMFDPTQGSGIFAITATYTPTNAVGTSTDPDDAICITTAAIEIIVNESPTPQFTCPSPNVSSCDGPVAINAMDANPLTAANSTGVWSGPGAVYIDDMGTATITDDILDPTGGILNVPFPLLLTLTSADGCSSVSAECTYTIVKLCDPNPVIKVQSGLRRIEKN